MAKDAPFAQGQSLRLALRRQRKVLLLLGLTVVLPAVALGFIGLRALEADRYRIEGLMRTEQEAALRHAVDELRSRVAEVLARLTTIADASSLSWEEIAGPAREAEAGALPGTLLVVSPAGDVFFVRERFIVSPDFDPRVHVSASQILEAETLELGKGQLQRARSRYEGLAQSDDPNLRSHATMGLARTYHRSGRHERALEIYRELATEWPEPLNGSLAANALIAALRVFDIETDRGELKSALPILTQAYRYLLVDRWVISPERVRFYAADLERRIEELCGKGNARTDCEDYGQVRHGKASRLEELEKLDLLQRGVRRSLDALPASATSQRELVFPHPDVVHATVFAVQKTPSDLAAVLIADDVSLAGRWLGDAFRATTAGLHLHLAHEDGEVLFDAGGAPGRVEAGHEPTELGDGLPEWTIAAFHDPDASPYVAARWMFLVMTLFLVLVLGLGVVLTARQVRQELELIRIKSDIVSLVSHEFKSPITSMRALIDRLRARSVTDPNRTQRYLHVVSSELQRLTRLVNNFLDFTRIETGTKRYHPSPTSLVALVEEVLVHFEARAEQLQFVVETHLEEVREVEIDRDAFEQAILNLLDNAVKYSPQEKWIGVSLRTRKDEVVLEVSDRGRGIAPEDKRRIFEPSYRAPVESSDQQGIGLGLAIVEHIMAAHGGKVEVDSEPGIGSRFRLVLPAANPKVLSQPVAENPPPVSKVS